MEVQSTNANYSCHAASEDYLTADLWKVERGGSGVLAVYFIFGVPLNLFVIIAILCKHLYSIPTYLLLFNLGFTDLFTCFIPILLATISGLQGEISFGESDYIRCQLCKTVVGYLLVTFARTFIIALLSFERLVYFASPLLHTNSVTPSRISLTLTFVWLLSIGFVIPPLIGYGDSTFALWCGDIFLSKYHLNRSAIYLALSGTFIAMIVIFLTVSNLWIAWIGTKSTRKMRTLHIAPRGSQLNITPQPSHVISDNVLDPLQLYSVARRQKSREVASQQMRLYQVYGTILLVDVLTTLPTAVLLFVLAGATKVPGEFVTFAQVTQLSQVILHPAIIAIIAPSIRKIIFHCPNKLRYTHFGKHMYKVYKKLVKCCMPSLWAMALEKELLQLNLGELSRAQSRQSRLRILERYKSNPSSVNVSKT
jgi:hypothetical protein